MLEPCGKKVDIRRADTYEAPAGSLKFKPGINMSLCAAATDSRPPDIGIFYNMEHLLILLRRPWPADNSASAPAALRAALALASGVTS